MSGNSVCIMFDKIEYRDLFLEKAEEITKEALDNFFCWDMEKSHQEVAVWVLLEDVPLFLWNGKFFREFLNRWGSFVKMDDDTAMRNILDCARILVTIDFR